MGSTTTRDLVETKDMLGLTLEDIVGIQLRCNFYPPHPSFMIPVVVRAIKKFNKGQWNTKVRLPEDVEHRHFGRLMPVPAVIEAFRLWEAVDDSAYQDYCWETGVN